MVVKRSFDFGWWDWKSPPIYADLAFRYQKGDILDVGCGTCQLYWYLRKRGWRGKYYGIDVERYPISYPKDAEIMIGDALKVKFPKVDTVVLYNILEHVEDPILLLKKAFKAAKHNVLVNVPKRNENLWKIGISEFHQLDKTHKHCGFSKEEVYEIVRVSGGVIIRYVEHSEISARTLARLWDNPIPRAVVYGLSFVFPSKKFYQEIWFEAIPRDTYERV